MIRWFGIVFIVLLFGVIPLIAADYFVRSGFLNDFYLEQSMPVMGAILAIYIATSCTLLAMLVSYEQATKEKIFNTTSKELKRNLIFVITLFSVQLVLLTATPKEIEEYGLIDLSLKAVKSFVLYLYIFSLYELSVAMFSFREKLSSMLEKNESS